MRRRYRFLRKIYKSRRVNKEFPYGRVSNESLLEDIKEGIRRGKDFILQF